MLHRNNPELMSGHKLYTDGKVKFHSDPNIIQLREWAFIYKNFLDDATFNKYNNILKTLKESDWNSDDSNGPFWKDKISLEIVGSDIHDPISKLLAPNFWLFKNTSFVRLRAGQNSEIETCTRYFAENKQRIIGHYKLALYFGDFEGGEICFPDQEIKYKPEPNDLLLFKIHQNYDHYTDTVTNGTRFAYQDIAIYNPAYFMP